MSCKNPLTGAVLGTDPRTGKKIIKILNVPYNEQKSLVNDTDIVPIPCGHCIDCRLSKSREWAMRCMFELETAKNKENCFFITLTYDDDHLPSNEYFDSFLEEHEKFELRKEFDNPWLQIIHDCSTIENLSDEKNIILEKSKLPYVHPIKYDDVQSFIKRLRSYFADNKRFNNIPHSCRYFGCAEYGPKNLRPHYHIIMYDVPLDDLEVKRIDKKNGYVYFTSKTISDRWYYGFHLITKVCFETCAYVSQYILKKQYGRNADVYRQLYIPPERTFMSRRPGIGREYYELHKFDIYSSDNVLVKKGDNSFYSRPPKYYDNLFDIDIDGSYNCCDENMMDLIQEDRLNDSILSLNMKKELTDLSYRDILKSEETNLTARTKCLKERSKINESFNC